MERKELLCIFCCTFSEIKRFRFSIYCFSLKIMLLPNNFSLTFQSECIMENIVDALENRGRRLQS